MALEAEGTFTKVQRHTHNGVDSPQVDIGDLVITERATAFDLLAPTTTKGDTMVHNGTDNVRLAVGTNSQVLTADSAQASGIKWATPASSGITTIFVQLTNSTNGVTGVTNEAKYVSLAATGATASFASFYVPSAPTSIKLLAEAASAETGDMKLDIETQSRTDGTTQSDSLAGNQVADFGGTSSPQEWIVPATAYDSLTTGRTWSFEVRRDGSHVDDANPAALNVMGLIIAF